MTFSTSGGSRPARTRVLITVVVVVAVVLIGLATRSLWQGNQGDQGNQPDQVNQDDQDDSGVVEPDPPISPDQAACDPVRSEPADENRHVDGGSLTYSLPPAFGDHSSRWAVLPRPFFVVADRPKVSVLVHNLEHGYNILWYDESVLNDSAALDQVRSIAAAYAGPGRDPADAFMAVPWTSADGDPMPGGNHYALTHWYADPQDRTRSRQDEIGYRMFCGTVTAEVVQQWMRDYPLRDAPEGYPINM